MSFESFADAGPHCLGDPVIINYCNCPEGSAVYIRAISPEPIPPQIVFTPIDGGIQVDNLDEGFYQFEVVCCSSFEQDPQNPFTPVLIPDGFEQ